MGRSLLSVNSNLRAHRIFNRYFITIRRLNPRRLMNEGAYDSLVRIICVFRSVIQTGIGNAKGVRPQINSVQFRTSRISHGVKSVCHCGSSISRTEEIWKENFSVHSIRYSRRRENTVLPFLSLLSKL